MGSAGRAVRSGLLLGACLAPAAAVFGAFWLLPMAWLVMLPASKGWATYAAVLTNPRYLQSLVNTLVLSLTVTLATLVIGAALWSFYRRRAPAVASGLSRPRA